MYVFYFCSILHYLLFMYMYIGTHMEEFDDLEEEMDEENMEDEDEEKVRDK